MSSPLSVALVVPAHRGGPILTEALAAIGHQDSPADEVVVVADGPAAGADLSLAAAVAAIGAKLEVSPRQGGPSAARNRGVSCTTAEVVLFVDSDVVLAPDVVGRVRKGLVEAAAVFGSYDDAPRDPAFTSQYKNLVHHLTHQAAAGSARTFWAGCGAVRREAFAEVGGFDESYARPCIEDVELGYRLVEAGHRIVLDPEMCSTHLKTWTVAGLLRTDLLDRALPWTALILRRGSLVDGLGTPVRARVQLGLTGVGWAGLLLAAGPGVGSGPRRVGVGIATMTWTLAVALDAPTLRGLAALRGPGFAVRSVPWRLAHQLVSASGLVAGATQVVAEKVGLVRTPTPRLWQGQSGS